MTTDKFCGNCGRERRSEDRFCPQCGKAFTDAPASIDLQKHAPPVPPERPEPPAPSKPFDPFRPVGPDNPVPDDCIWATAPYPGPLPKDVFYGSVPKRIRKIGTLRGRPATEIINVLGPPHTINAVPGGGQLRQWIKISAYTGTYHYVLRFDPYDICIGITKQTG